jgi:hypothetical protein
VNPLRLPLAVVRLARQAVDDAIFLTKLVNDTRAMKPVPFDAERPPGGDGSREAVAAARRSARQPE